MTTFSLLAVATLAQCSAELAEPVLESWEGLSTWNAVYNHVFDHDAAADDAWRTVESKAVFDARRHRLQNRMREQLGGFPLRTPLNARVTDRIVCTGYAVENVLFESRPGAYVTGNLYLPDPERFAPPYAAALETCGHSIEGKGAQLYKRAAILCAKNGIAVLVIDPLGQGERIQCPEESGAKASPVRNHLRMGVNAMLLGHGLAAFMLWDAMRALDYLDTRADIRHGGYGALGNSGGGTQCIMLSALDDRVKATFLARQLLGNDAHFDESDEDYGPVQDRLLVTGGKGVAALPGFKSVYDFLREELEVALSSRRPMSAAERASLVRRLADVDERRVGVRHVKNDQMHPNGMRVIRSFFKRDDGCRLPMVELIPNDSAGRAPVLFVSDESRTNCASAVWTALSENRPVAVADLSACGEIGATRHHYCNPNNDEEVAKMLYLLGSSLTGRRAEELIAIGSYLSAQYGAKPALLAFGRVAVAAAHARAVAPGVIADVKVVDAPHSWVDTVRVRAYSDYATSVHGALLHYDWIELLESTD